MSGLWKWSARWYAKPNQGMTRWSGTRIPVEALPEPDKVHGSYMGGNSDGPAEVARAAAEFPDLYLGEP